MHIEPYILVLPNTPTLSVLSPPPTLSRYTHFLHPITFLLHFDAYANRIATHTLVSSTYNTKKIRMKCDMTRADKETPTHS